MVMNFDELKAQWDNDSNNDIHVPENLDQLKAAQTPIDAVRKKMKNEFFLQIIFLIIGAFAPVIFDMSSILTIVFFFCYGLMVTFTSYYFYKFFVFYKKSYDLNYDTRKNLLWFYYELKLNIELYKALNYILFFIGFIMGVLLFVALKASGTEVEIPMLDKIIDKFRVWYFVGMFVFSLLFSFGLAELIPRLYYGKYLKQIKTILEDLDE